MENNRTIKHIPVKLIIGYYGNTFPKSYCPSCGFGALEKSGNPKRCPNCGQLFSLKDDNYQYRNAVV